MPAVFRLLPGHKFPHVDFSELERLHTPGEAFSAFWILQCFWCCCLVQILQSMTNSHCSFSHCFGKTGIKQWEFWEGSTQVFAQTSYPQNTRVSLGNQAKTERKYPSGNSQSLCISAGARAAWNTKWEPAWKAREFLGGFKVQETEGICSSSLTQYNVPAFLAEWAFPFAL